MDQILEAAGRVAQQAEMLEQYREFLADVAFVLGDQGDEAHDLSAVIGTLSAEVAGMQDAFRQYSHTPAR